MATRFARTMVHWSRVAAPMLLIGCASGSDTPPGTGGAETHTAPEGGSTTTAFGGSGTTSGDSTPWNGLPWSPAPCSEATQYIYVVEETGFIYRFWPPTGAFTLVGFPRCGSSFAPWSMGIDRFATAWIESNEDMFLVDLATGACTDAHLDYAGSQPGFRKYGLAFAKTSPESDDERLYAWGTSADVGDVAAGERFLGMFDPATGRIATLAQGYGYNADLTSMGHRLFGFQNPAGQETWTKLVEIDTTTAHFTSSVELTGVNIGRDWAMAAWGGDFYLFTDSASTGTAVVRYRPETEELSWLPVPAVGFHVIGAGVSTCAPTAPPPA